MDKLTEELVRPCPYFVDTESRPFVPAGPKITPEAWIVLQNEERRKKEKIANRRTK